MIIRIILFTAFLISASSQAQLQKVYLENQPSNGTSTNFRRMEITLGQETILFTDHTSFPNGTLPAPRIPMASWEVPTLVQFERRVGALEAQVTGLNTKYSESCLAWPQKTIEELKKSENFSGLVEALMADPEFVAAVAKALAEKKSK